MATAARMRGKVAAARAGLKGAAGPRALGASAARPQCMVPRRPAASGSRMVCRAAEQDMAEKMAIAQKRWDAQIAEGKVQAVTTKEAGQMIKDGWTLLDVRPPEEVKRGSVTGAVTVPMFVIDDDTSPGGLLRQMSAFGMGGWWVGNKHMKPNDSFMRSVTQNVPTEASVIIACQKGLRSLAACERLATAGYKKIAWVNGGFDNYQPGDLPVEGKEDIRFAGTGGLSSVLGWTDVQKKVSEEDAVMGGPFGTVIKVTAVLVILDSAWFAVTQIPEGFSLSSLLK